MRLIDIGLNAIQIDPGRGLAGTVVAGAALGVAALGVAAVGRGLPLFLIWQNQNDGYDTYRSAVVAAPDEAAAQRILPTLHLEAGQTVELPQERLSGWWYDDWQYQFGWVRPESVCVEPLASDSRFAKPTLISNDFFSG